MKSSCAPILELSLSAACAALDARIVPLGQERVPLGQALGRVCAAAVIAGRPSPSCDQSARDGFALAARPLAADHAVAVFQVIGEMAAGCSGHKALAPGQAVRIMTGAPAPSGCVRVAPFEVCQERDGTVLAPLAELAREQVHIRRQGQDIRAGQVLVSAGTRILPDHLLLLAENGCKEMAVHCQPKAAVICTGSELVGAGEPLRPGEKVSSNGVLLASLLRTQGCLCVRTAIAADKAGPTAALIQEIVGHDRPDLLITTGGMGPGKFDLTEQVFALIGGKPLCNRLRVRPGRSTLAGMLGTLPFLGLPGPPTAVRLLFHELVAPILRRLGGETAANGLAEALLDQPPAARKAEAAELVLQGGTAWIDREGRLRVRPAGQLEPVNAVIRLRGNAGQRVEIRLTGPLGQGLAV